MRNFATPIILVFFLFALSVQAQSNESAQDQKPPVALVVPGEVILGFKETGAANGRIQLPSNLSKISGGVFSFRSTGFADGSEAVPLDKKLLSRDCEYAKNRILKLGIATNIDSCEPNFVFKATKTSNDTYMSYLDAAFKSSKINDAWEVTTGDRKIVVAVIDTGVDYNHPDLKDNMYRNSGEIPDNNIDDDRNGFVDDVHGYDFAANDGDPMDKNGHGTHCAGTIGAVGDNLLGVAGVNWQVSIMALKFLGDNGSGTTTGAIKAIDYAVNNGAKVLSNSWGALLAYSAPLLKAIKRAEAKGVIFVAAAGNDGLDNEEYPTYPASFDASNIVSVAAIDPKSNKLASFSNFGKRTVDIAAPGVDILSTYPGGGYAFMSGTSMATPHVAGALALLLAVRPEAGMDTLLPALLERSQFSKELYGKVSSAGTLDVYGSVKELAPETPTNGNSSSSSTTSGEGSNEQDSPQDDSDSSSSSGSEEVANFEYVLLAGRANAKGQISNGAATRKVGLELLASSEQPSATDKYSITLSSADNTCEIVSDRPIKAGESLSSYFNLPALNFKATFDLLLTSESGGEAMSSLRLNLCRSGKKCSSEPSLSNFKRICALFKVKSARR